MNDTSDSDDSAFLITTSFSKRKNKTNVDETKKTKSTDNLGKNEIINLDEGTAHGKGGDLTIQTSSVASANNFNQTQFEKENFEKCMVADESSTFTNKDNIKQKSKLLHSSISNYYSCPLCLKTFDSEITHISHMKQCAKKSKMTPKQLLQALEMHKDELKRRVQSGLSPFSPPRKKKKTGNQENPESSYELALGLALSKSLSEVNPNHPESHNLSFKNNTMKNNKITLESFGFTNSNCNFGGTGRRKLKNWKTARCALRQRTKEQREGLITEKAAVILLCKDYEMEFYKKTEQAGLYDLKYGYIRESERERSLWKLGENEDNTNWYVQNIKCFLLDGVKECVNGGHTQNSDNCEIAEVIKRLNLPQTSFSQDWRKLVNNKHLSDLNFLSESSEIFYLHSVVLYARCPTMLDLDLQSVFGRFNTVTIHSFLQYLYCGVLDGLKRCELENLFELAQSINFEELRQILSILKKNLNGSEKDEIAHELNKTLCQKEGNDRSNLDEKIEFLNTSHQIELLKLNSQISSSNSNDSFQECIRQTCNIEDVENKANQNFIKSSEDKGEALWEPKKTENPANHMQTEEQIYETLNGKDENKLSSTDKSLIPNEESSDKCSEVEDLEKDMFEETDVLSHTNNIPDTLNDNPPHCEDNVNECILVSSGSSNDGCSNEERREELNEQNEEFPLTDCEIPYFDPYEHFNSEIPIPDSPVLNEEEILRSQSLFLDNISCVKLSSPCPENSPRNEGISFPDLEPVTPIAMRSVSRVSDFCSTPIIRLDTPKSTSNRNKYSRKYSKRRETGKSQSLCFKRNRSVIASRLKKTKLLKSGSGKKKRKISRDVKSDEEDSEKETDISTGSILKDFDNSFQRTTEKSPESHTRKFIEVTPIAVGEEFSEEVTPLPDYSIMDASGIKKHLTKYGLKKSLSKNKAKRILRHIYEELHPLINTRNGKIIKYEPMEKKKQSRKKCEGKKRKNLKGKNMQPAKEKSLNENGVLETSCKNQGEVSSGNCSILTRSEEEDAASPSGDTNTLERSDELIFERSDSEIQGFQSQTSFSSVNDVAEAVFDFIHSNPEIHRRILMYEPIWLENFRKQLYEKYNKKFKLTDIMDCLDAECITFRCESQSRTNRTRKTRNNKSKNLKNK